jgi:hypothetical protein
LGTGGEGLLISTRILVRLRARDASCCRRPGPRWWNGISEPPAAETERSTRDERNGMG